MTTRAIHSVLLASALAAASPALLAQQAPAPGAQDGALPAAGAAAQSDMTEAEVRRVDRSANKVTLRHGPIKSLDMPAMTMVFHAADPSLLDKVKAGDKVRFSARQDGGTYVVTDLQPAQ